MNLLNYILPVIYALIFGWLFYRYHPLRKSGIQRELVLGGFLYKIMFGVILWMIYSMLYTNHGNLDIFRFYDDARIMYSALPAHPDHFFQMLTGIGGNQQVLDQYYMEMNNWYKQYNYFLYNDARTLIRFNAFIMLFSFGAYHVHTVFMAAFSYLGILYLAKAFFLLTERNRVLIFAASVFVPSVALWSSGVLKEGIFMGAFGFFIYTFFQMMNGPFNRKYMAVFLASIFLLMVIKVYLLICLVPGVVYMVLGKVVLPDKPLLRFVMVQCLLILILVLLPVVFPQYDLFYVLYKKRIDFMNEAMLWNAGSLVSVPELKPTALSFAGQVPFALLMVIFRPYPWEAHSMQMLASSAENILLALLMLLPFMAFRKPDKKVLACILFSLSFVTCLYLLIGTITPVLGSLVRYKVPGIPLLLIVVVLLTDFEKLKRKTGLRKKDHG